VRLVKLVVGFNMKIDNTNGNIIFGNGEVLGSASTRSSFLTSQNGNMSNVLVENEPWCSFSFNDENKSMSVAISFHGEILDSINVSVIGPEYGESWSDYDEVKEMARKESNDNWLISNGLIPGHQYSWGSARSYFDKKSGFSTVIIRYEIKSQQDNPPDPRSAGR
jgi:hypothetical protein